MEKKVIVAAVWAFAKNNQPGKVYAAALRLITKDSSGTSKDMDNILKKVVDYYLRQIKPFKPRQAAPEYDQAKTLRYLELAYDISGRMYSAKRRRLAKERTIMKGVECLKKSDASIDGLVDFLYKVLSDSTSLYFDAFARKIIKAYLGIPRLEGQEISRIIKLMSTMAGLAEAERLIPIFIDRGDYEAIRVIGEKYGKLGETIVSRSREIIFSCLKRGNIQGAIKMTSLMTAGSECQGYCQLLGIDYASLQKEKEVKLA